MLTHQKFKKFVLLALEIFLMVALGGTNKTSNFSCGISKASVSFRIQGGQSSPLKAWPWMAAVFMLANDSSGAHFRHVCGGSVISNRHILTAGHCVVHEPDRKPRPPGEFKIRFGDSDTNSDKDGANPTEFQVELVILYYRYSQIANYTNFRNDLAVLKLAAPITFSDSIQPVCLPTKEMTTETFVGKKVVTAGWGALQYLMKGHLKLGHVQLEVQSNKDCVAQHIPHKGNITVLPDHLCAGAKQGYKSVCHGDSGGPLMLSVEGRWYVVGITSASLLCGTYNLPSVFTKVTSYREWINQQVDGIIQVDLDGKF